MQPMKAAYGGRGSTAGQWPLTNSKDDFQKMLTTAAGHQSLVAIRRADEQRDKNGN